jgi:hypothetical protein
MLIVKNTEVKHSNEEMRRGFNWHENKIDSGAVLPH